jgi:putative toxin-antitoxin system antitoxin component (TIGR02293 family)
MSEDRAGYGARLAELLGGSPHEVREAGEWHAQILEGLPFEVVEKVKARASLTDAGMARLLGIGAATLRRARARALPLDATTSDRLYRLSKVIAAAEDVLYGPENARSWLRRPQPGLGGQLPLDLLLTQAGADQVETLLRRIEHGVYT